MVTLFEFGRCPVRGEPAGRRRGGLVPSRPALAGRRGARTARPKKLRPLTAMFSIAGPSSVYERSPLLACNAVTRPRTVTLSLTSPISIVVVPAETCRSRSRRGGYSRRLEAARDSLSVYVSGRTYAKT